MSAYFWNGLELELDLDDGEPVRVLSAASLDAEELAHWMAVAGWSDDVQEGEAGIPGVTISYHVEGECRIVDRAWVADERALVAWINRWHLEPLAEDWHADRVAELSGCSAHDEYDGIGDL